MPKQYDDYEEFILSLVDNVKKHGSTIRDIGCGRNNKIRGKSGQSHQIDVSFIDESSFSKPALVLIECKRNALKNHVSASVPKILKYNADDIKDNPKYHAYDVKMIITATSPFSSGAKRIADFEQIQISTVNHGPPYGFSYGNLVELFMQDALKTDDWAGAEIVHKRKK